VGDAPKKAAANAPAAMHTPAPAMVSQVIVSCDFINGCCSMPWARGCIRLVAALLHSFLSMIDLALLELAC